MVIASIQNNQLWLNAVKIVEEIYFVTKGFPLGDDRAMRYQMRRDSVSITLNIAKALLNGESQILSGSVHACLRACSSLMKCLIICRSYGWICLEEFMSLINKIDEQVGLIYKGNI